MGKLLDLEAEHTYRDPAGGETRRRWVRLLCQDRVQVSLVAQGSSEQAYAYWLPMFNTVMRTVRFADWWAESTGTSWQASLVGDQPPGRPWVRAHGPLQRGATTARATARGTAWITVSRANRRKRSRRATPTR